MQVMPDPDSESDDPEMQTFSFDEPISVKDDWEVILAAERSINNRFFPFICTALGVNEENLVADIQSPLRSLICRRNPGGPKNPGVWFGLEVLPRAGGQELKAVTNFTAEVIPLTDAPEGTRAFSVTLNAILKIRCKEDKFVTRELVVTVDSGNNVSVVAAEVKRGKAETLDNLLIENSKLTLYWARVNNVLHPYDGGAPGSGKEG